MEKQNNFNEYAFSLIIDEFEGVISDSQKKELQAWRQASAENEKIYQEFHLIKSEVESLAEFRKLDVDLSWQKVEDELDAKVIPFKEGLSTEKTSKTSNKKSSLWLYKIAASVILIAGLFIFRPSGSDTLKTAKGEHRRIVLPDGSWLALNEKTTIQYDPSSFTDKRELTLVNGGAYFEVKHNPLKPFLIKTNEATIEDLGTAFMVTKSRESVKVLVRSGKVALKSLATGRSKVISAGSSGVYLVDRKVITDTPKAGNEELQWMNTQLTFVNADLSDIVARLERVYGQNIIIKDSALKHRKLTAPLAFQTVDSALSVISASLQVKVSRSGSSFVISK